MYYTSHLHEKVKFLVFKAVAKFQEVPSMNIFEESAQHII